MGKLFCLAHCGAGVFAGGMAAADFSQKDASYRNTFLFGAIDVFRSGAHMIKKEYCLENLYN